MARFPCPSTIGTVAFLSLLSVAAPAAGQEGRSVPSLRAAIEDAGSVIANETAAGAAADIVERPEHRPSALLPLYVSFGALQVLDTHSTSRALGNGAVEANPLMKGIARNELGMIAVKAAGTAGVIYASEKMWKKNRKAAVIFMIASNAAMAWVVQHNYRAGR